MAARSSRSPTVHDNALDAVVAISTIAARVVVPLAQSRRSETRHDISRHMLHKRQVRLPSPERDGSAADIRSAAVCIQHTKNDQNCCNSGFHRLSFLFPVVARPGSS